MTKHNPFTSTSHDLGVSDSYGVDIGTATHSILRTPNTHTCYVCTSTAQYRVLAKDNRDITAQIQKGLFICGHCITTGALDNTRYALQQL